MTPDGPRIEQWVRQAVDEAYREEERLFRERAHERSIVFHIARRLAISVGGYATELSVDVEYDRWRRDDIETVKKHLRTADRPSENDVYPDVIVHLRGVNSGNVLVMEAKKEEADAADRSHDKEKLRAFLCEPFRYQHAAFLELPAHGGAPRCEWVCNESATGRIPCAHPGHSPESDSIPIL